MAQYNQWYQYVEHQKRERERANLPPEQRARLTPLHFPHRHSRVSFGSRNELIVIQGSSVVIQSIDPSLLDYAEEVSVSTWPGPLIKGETNKDEVLEYIRTLESSLKYKGAMQPLSASSSNLDDLDSVSLQNPEAYFKVHERRQMWSLLSMAVKQTGTVSGADMAELLLSNNESEFETPEEGDDIGKVRRFLTLGQKKTALEFSQKSLLWGHATSLILFTPLLGSISPTGSSSITPSSPTNESLLSNQLSNMVSKFINQTLQRDDPLFILYRCLLSKLQLMGRNRTQTASDSPPNKCVAADTLQQFAILIANDCEVSPGVSSYGRSSELLKLMVSMRSNATRHLVNLSNLDVPEALPASNVTAMTAVKYSDELIFLNEVWEFCRNKTEFIEILVPFKAILAARLFDFGLINQATKYCYALRQYNTYYHLYFEGKTIDSDSSLDWDILMNFVTDLESRIYGFDVTGQSQQQVNESAKKKTPVKTPSPKKTKSTTPDETSRSSGRKRADYRQTEDDSVDEDEDEELEDEVIDDESEDLSEKAVIPVKTPATSVEKTTPKTYQPQQQSTFTPTQSSTVKENPYQHHPGIQRRRTLSREDSQEASSPSPLDVSPVKNNPIPSFDNLSLNRSASLGGSDSVLNFVSTPSSNLPILPLPGDNLVKHSGYIEGGVNDRIEEEDDSIGASDSRRDSFGGPFSSTQRNIPFNSTAAPGASGSPFSPFQSAFSPIGSPEVAPSGYGNGSVRRSSHPETNTSTAPVNTTTNETEEKKKGGGLLSYLGFKSSAVVRAVLPDDSNKSIVWDEKLKMWVDKNDPSSMQQATQMLSGPPKMPIPGMTAPQPQVQSKPIESFNVSSNGSVPPASMPSGPSSLPMMSTSSAPQNSFTFISNKKKKPQYIDVWQQQQKRN